MKIPEERKIENLTVKEISYIEVIKKLQNTKTKKYRKINKTLTRNSKEEFIKYIHLHTSKQQDKQTNNNNYY